MHIYDWFMTPQTFIKSLQIKNLINQCLREQNAIREATNGEPYASHHWLDEQWVRSDSKLKTIRLGKDGTDKLDDRLAIESTGICCEPLLEKHN